MNRAFDRAFGHSKLEGISPQINSVEWVSLGRLVSQGDFGLYESLRYDRIILLDDAVLVPGTGVCVVSRCMVTLRRPVPKEIVGGDVPEGAVVVLEIPVFLAFGDDWPDEILWVDRNTSKRGGSDVEWFGVMNSRSIALDLDETRSVLVGELSE